MALAVQKQTQAPGLGWLALVKAVERLSVADELAEILEIMQATANDVSGVDGVCFLQRDGDFCQCIEERAIGPLWKGLRLPMSGCVSGWCLSHNQTAVIPDTRLDPRVPQELYRPTFVRSLVSVPIRTNEMLGVIASYWARPRRFSAEDVSFIEAMGRAASVAIAATQLRETLRDNEHRLSPDEGRSWKLNLATGELSANAACKAIFGLPPDAPLTREAILFCIHPEDRERAWRLFDAGLEPDPVTYRVRRHGGERRLEIRRHVVLGADGRPESLAGVMRDPGRRPAGKTDKAPRPDELQTARLNDLGEMASTLAHELNQPLAAAGNYMHAAEKLLGKDAERALAAIGKAEAQFNRATLIIQRIRGFVGRGGSTRTAEDLRVAFGDVLELAKASLRHRGVVVRLAIEEQLPRVKIDKIQIQQVLLNLLRNAFEALAQASRQEVVVSARKMGAEIEIRVADSGPGLKPEIALRLFEPFQTTKKNGMGVGLSLCRKIVEAHDGRIWHEAGNPGAVFCFTLPAAE